jgi:hypothetical protein
VGGGGTDFVWERTDAVRREVKFSKLEERANALWDYAEAILFDSQDGQRSQSEHGVRNRSHTVPLQPEAPTALNVRS